jgi:hypothetical protein
VEVTKNEGGRFKLKSIRVFLQTSVEFEGKMGKPLVVKTDKIEFKKGKYSKLAEFHDELIYTVPAETDIIGITSHRIKHEIIVLVRFFAAFKLLAFSFPSF